MKIPKKHSRSDTRGHKYDRCINCFSKKIACWNQKVSLPYLTDKNFCDGTTGAYCKCGKVKT